jgi:hypothetical protein
MGVTMPLTLAPNLADPDGFYQELIDSQRDLDEASAALMNARLVLLLANHIGDRETLSEALKLARPPGR